MEISEITRGLKAIAKELNVPVLALSQLSRAVELPRRQAAAIGGSRESGSIEQDADVVMFVYREQYYHERKKPDEGRPDRMSEWQNKGRARPQQGQLIIAKQRHGPDRHGQPLLRRQHYAVRRLGGRRFVAGTIRLTRGTSHAG